jgi:hypothetical protein
MAFQKPGETRVGKGQTVQTQVLFCDFGKWFEFIAYYYLPNHLTLMGAVILFKGKSIIQALKQKLEVTLRSHEHNLLIPDSVLLRPRREQQKETQWRSHRHPQAT